MINIVGELRIDVGRVDLIIQQAAASEHITNRAANIGRAQTIAIGDAAMSQRANCLQTLQGDGQMTLVVRDQDVCGVLSNIFYPHRLLWAGIWRSGGLRSKVGAGERTRWTLMRLL